VQPKLKRTENGPRWESHNPGKGCNSTHVARARKAWKRLKNRVTRRKSKQGLDDGITGNDTP